MIRIACSFTRTIFAAALIGVTVLATVPAAAASGNETPSGTWLAASGSQTSTGPTLGRLVLRDGVVTFNASANGWQLAVSEIKRAAMDQSDRLVVESMTGEIYYMTILDARMEPDSARAALKLIQKALPPPARR